ncbi:MAG TPA: NUDIX hydrolase [Alphaproteobacteria bacterium]|jgi:ADP-ribose pyrophosphatase|nr:NUDIX hydrolase [Alphaproteobacteria bacterium]
MTTPPLRPWTVLSETPLLSLPPFIDVSTQRVALPDGRVVDNYYQVRMPDFAVICPVLDDGRFLMQRSYRHGPRRICLNFPGGHLSPGESAVDAARRELLEETGHAANTWRELGSFVTNANHRCQTAYFFKATGCRLVATPDSGDLEEVEHIAMTYDEVAVAARNGDFALTTQIAMFALATHPAFAG